MVEAKRRKEEGGRIEGEKEGAAFTGESGSAMHDREQGVKAAVV